MKTIKYLALTLVALVGMTSCSNDDNHQTIDDTYAAWVYASFSYAPNYYSSDGTVNVKMEDGVYTITAKNKEWGEAVFKNVKMGEQWEGSGTITVPARREIEEPKTYDAQISGTLNDIVITAPTLMNAGTVLHFYIGRIPGAKTASRGRMQEAVPARIKTVPIRTMNRMSSRGKGYGLWFDQRSGQ